MLGPPDIISQYAPCVTLYVLARSLNPLDTGPLLTCALVLQVPSALSLLWICLHAPSLRYFFAMLRCCISHVRSRHVCLLGAALCLIPDAGVAFVLHLHAYAPLTSIRLCVASPVPFRLRLLFCAGTPQDGCCHVAYMEP